MIKKLNIGYFTDTYLPAINGVVTSILSFKKETEKLGHTIYTFAPRVPAGKVEGKGIFLFPSTRSLFYPDIRESIPFSPRVIRAMGKLDLDIAHIQTPGQIGLFGTNYAIRNRIPLVFTYHTLYPEYFAKYKKATFTLLIGMLVYPLIVVDPGEYKELAKVLAQVKLSRDWNRKIAEKLSVVICRQMQGVIAPSVKIKKMLLEWGVKQPIEIIPSGIELKEFKKRRANPMSRFGFEKKKVIVFAGRLGFEKNLELLIHSAARVMKHEPSARLLIMGDGPAKKSLEKTVRDLGIGKHVHFTGFLQREEVIAAFQHSNVFVFPSMTDTQGLAVLEAAASGLPLVMVDREITDVLVPGKNGFYAKNEVKDMASKMLKVLTLKSRRNLSQFSMNAVKKYSSEAMNKKLLVFYDKIIRSKK